MLRLVMLMDVLVEPDTGPQGSTNLFDQICLLSA